MPELRVERKRLLIGDKVVEFLYGIDNVRACGDMLVVLLDIPSDSQAVNNVYGVDVTGRIIWQVQDPAEVYAIQNDVPYVGIRITRDGEIIVTNFNGVTYELDPATGRILDRGTTK
jgi:outer membrane protein assembly factor BamB